MYLQIGIESLESPINGTEVTETGKRTMIRKVSDFLWYSLDSWGREHPNDDQPQCESEGDCLGEEGETTEQKCCASIRFREASTMGENLYIYRCLNRGLIGANVHFIVPGSDIDT